MSELPELAWAWRLNNDEAALLYSISKAQKSNRSEVRILLMHTGVTGSLLNAVGELFSNGSITVVEHRGDGGSSLSKLGDIRANVSSTTVRDQVELHRLIAASGPFNLIVDVMCGLGTAYRQRLFSLFFPALVDGGCFLLAGLDKIDTEELRDVIGFYGRLASLVAGTDASAAGDVRALSQLIQTLSIGRGVIALERRGESLVKLRHGEVEMILSARFGSRWGRTLARRGARKYDSSTLKWTNRPAVAESRLMATVRCPEIAVREYSDVAVRPRQIISRENLLYPDTFRLGGAQASS